MSTKKNAGVVTAYGAAVEGGYQGTYEEFCALMADLGVQVGYLESMTVTVTMLDPAQSPSASYGSGTLTLNIPRGQKGDKGDKGDKGNTGNTGATPNISIGTVSTGAAGTDAVATITGTPESPVLNLTIPKGADGAVPAAAIAPTESTLTASRAYAVGERFWYSGTLYIATAPIASGGAIVISGSGANVKTDDIGADLTAQSDRIDELKIAFDEMDDSSSELVINDGENRLDLTKLKANTFIDQTNGAEDGSSSYTATDWIYVADCKEKIITIGRNGTMANIALRYAFYKEDKTFISGALWDSSTRLVDQYPAKNSNFGIIDVPLNAYYLRFSAINSFFQTYYPYVFSGNILVPISKYTQPRKKLKNNFPDKRYLPTLSESVGNKFGNSWKSVSLDNSTELNLGVINSLKGRETISVFLKIATMGEIRIGFNGNSYLLHVDGTYYGFTRNGGTWDSSSKFPHNLAMKDYLYVFMELEEDGAHMNGRIVTNGGIKEIQNQTFTGTRGRPYIKSAGFVSAASQPAKISWMAETSKPIWVFGDSYISNYSRNRWGYYLIEWGLSNNVLFNGFPGQQSSTGIEDFKNLLNLGTPAYAVWCLGMNDGDNGAINSSWEECAEKFISLCEEKGITPILATIPNVPNVTHTYKNAWVKSSGYRYVDFAQAVNAESAGATWFDNMLSDDNTHPDVQGAICLASAFIDFVPEVKFKS